MSEAEAALKSKQMGKTPAGQSRMNQSVDSPSLQFDKSEPLPYLDPKDHYHIGTTTRYFIHLGWWLGEYSDDPVLAVSGFHIILFILTWSIQDFLPCLKDHLLGQLLNCQYDGDDIEFSPDEHTKVIIHGDWIYCHKVLRINYTTYNLRCEQDSLNPRIHADVMVLSHENDAAHPYWYAWILSVFHAVVSHRRSTEPQCMDFLWVRWFGIDPNNYRSGWKAKWLHHIRFIPHDTKGSFSFLDPKEVICAVHLIPTFAYGQTDSLLPPSIARPSNDNNEDWVFYYVNM